MEQRTHASRLRYLNADDVDDSVVDFHNLDVHGPDEGKLGTIDGFIIDTDASRLLYVVVDSGGWFSSQRFLLPVGHAQLAPDRHALHVDVTKDALSRYPEFDEDTFRTSSDDALRTYDARVAAACCPDEVIAADTAWPDAARMRRHYAQPSWWRAESYDGRTREDERTRKAATDANARPRDESPHYDGRAQPGDVLGIETSGERTEIGDTANDEDERRREGIESAPERDRR